MKPKKVLAEVRKHDEVLFIGETKLAAGQVRLHRGGAEKELIRSLEHVKEDWKVVVGQVAEMVSGTDDRVTAAGYELSEVNISLGFNAKGKLAFIAEAGVEASVSIVFKRKD